jgi:hypothetical protein
MDVKQHFFHLATTDLAIEKAIYILQPFQEEEDTRIGNTLYGGIPSIAVHTIESATNEIIRTQLSNQR